MPDSLERENLEATRYCDFHHPAIQARAAELARGAEDTYQLALGTFQWVRDRIPFGFDFIKVKTSDTLLKGYGACFNKSLLLVALLRANGIPARFCSVPVSRWFMKPYAGLRSLLINDPFYHCLVQVEVDGEWSFAEPTLDRASYEALFLPTGVTWGIDWNRDAQDRLYLEHLRGEPQIHHDIDRAIDRNLGNALLPAPLVRFFSNSVNRNAWSRVGVAIPASPA